MAQPQPQREGSFLGEDLSGTAVGRFAVRTRLGGGGMGEVYLAEDSALKRSVALKRVCPHLRADPQFRQRLLREAERASALNHQNIAGIHDVLDQQGELFLVMEYVEGETLRQRMAGPVPLDEFLSIALQCAEALVAAHQAGVVHCDIKPENIMLRPPGQVKILDFGVAQHFWLGGDATAQTVSVAARQGLSGTPAYMAPEVLRERPPDARCDLFSLGVVFYEMLAGKHPFRAATFVETAQRILHEPPPPLTAARPELPAELDRIVRKLLAKEPDERYATARDLLADLHALRRMLDAGAALPAHAPARPWRKRILLGLVAAAAMTFLLSLPGVRHWLLQPAGSSPVPAVRHIAVLPFTSISENPSDQVFCDGLVETLTSKLTQIERFQGSLRVVPSSDIRRGGAETVQEARRNFGVNLVLTGSMQRSGDSVRLTANLVDATTLRQLRSQVFDGQITDVSLWQDEAVVAVARMLDLELNPDSHRVLAAGGTDSSEAFRLYTEGRGLLQRFEKRENVERAAVLFERAIAADPRYALAYAGLCEADWRRYELTKDSDWVGEARQQCQRALELDDTLAPVHVALGMVLSRTGRHEEAIGELRRALEIDPLNAQAYRELGRASEARGDLAAAEATLHRSIQLRPDDWAAHNTLGVFYYRHGRYAEAEAPFQRVIALTPDNPRGYINLGGLYHLMGRLEDAEAMLRQSLQVQPTSFAYSNLGTVYFFQQRYAEAVPMFEKALELGEKTYLLQGNLADAYRWAPGHQAQAPAAFRQAIELAKAELEVNPRDAEVLSSIAVYQAKLGERKQAQAGIRSALAEAPNNVNVQFKAAIVYQLAGQRERAIQALERAVQGGYSVAEVRASPEFRPLHRDPRFRALAGVQ
jgi:serine/threonine-protein kinase